MQETPLSLIRSLAARRYPSLLKPHPLRETSEEQRLQYLALLAFCLSIGREASHAETQVFSALAECLDIAEDEAQEQFQQRASLNSNTLETLLQSLQEQQLHWAWLIDVVWLQGVNGQPATEEVATTAELAALWGIEHSWLGDLRQLINLMRARDFEMATLHAESMLKQEKHSQLVQWIKNSQITLKLKLNTDLNESTNPNIAGISNSNLAAFIAEKILGLTPTQQNISTIKADELEDGVTYFVEKVFGKVGKSIKYGSILIELSKNPIPKGNAVIYPFYTNTNLKIKSTKIGAINKINLTRGDPVTRNTELLLIEELT